MIVTRVYFFLLRRGLFSGRFVRRVLLVDFFYEILFCAVVIAGKKYVKNIVFFDSVKRSQIFHRHDFCVCYFKIGNFFYAG